MTALLHSGERGPWACRWSPGYRDRIADDGTVAQFSGQGWTALPALPALPGRLASLTELDLRNNRLADLPDWLGNVTRLTNLERPVAAPLNTRWPPPSNGERDTTPGTTGNLAVTWPSLKATRSRATNVTAGICLP